MRETAQRARYTLLWVRKQMADATAEHWFRGFNEGD